MQILRTANPRTIIEPEYRGPYVMQRVRGLFMRSVDNHHVMTVLYGPDNTAAFDRAHSRALASLRDTEAIGRGSFAGDFGLHFKAYHYCEDIITALRYDRSMRLWVVTVQRRVFIHRYNDHYEQITFDLYLTK